MGSATASVASEPNEPAESFLSVRACGREDVIGISMGMCGSKRRHASLPTVLMRLGYVAQMRRLCAVTFLWVWAQRLALMCWGATESYCKDVRVIGMTSGGRQVD